MNKDTIQKKRERSVAYPSFSLEQAINSVSQLRKALGKGPYSRDEAAKALGYSGISATKISTMVHFGLLNRNGNTYSQSELAERINHQLSDEDRNNAIVEAILSPKLYKELIEQFAGEALPVQLGNILIRKGISSKISETVATNFQQSLEFSGLLKNGVVLTSPEFLITTDNDGIVEKEITPTSSNKRLLDENIKQVYIFNDSGDGWNVAIKSEKPITSKIKKLIIDAMELLEVKE